MVQRMRELGRRREDTAVRDVAATWSFSALSGVTARDRRSPSSSSSRAASSATASLSLGDLALFASSATGSGASSPVGTAASSPAAAKRRSRSSGWRYFTRRSRPMPSWLRWRRSCAPVPGPLAAVARADRTITSNGSRSTAVSVRHPISGRGIAGHHLCTSARRQLHRRHRTGRQRVSRRSCGQCSAWSPLDEGVITVERRRPSPTSAPSWRRPDAPTYPRSRACSASLSPTPCCSDTRRRTTTRRRRSPPPVRTRLPRRGRRRHAARVADEGRAAGGPTFGRAGPAHGSRSCVGAPTGAARRRRRVECPRCGDRGAVVGRPSRAHSRARRGSSFPIAREFLNGPTRSSPCATAG